MIKIDNTPNNLGISIHGDYQDLSELRDAIFRYLDFYYENHAAELKELLEDGSLEQRAYDSYLSEDNNCHEFLLALCYDIRHAYQGARDVEFVENNAESIGLSMECIYEIPTETRREFNNQRKKGASGNLYFSVPVLYPLMEFYVRQLTDILDYYYGPSSFESLSFDYDELQAEYDQALIQLMISLYNKSLGDYLGNGAARNIARCFDITEYPISSEIFAEAMSHCYVTKSIRFPRNEELKKALLTAICYNMISSDELYDDEVESPRIAAIIKNGLADYTAALETIRNITGEEFANYDNFSARLHDYVASHGGVLYENVFDDFLDEEYGPYDWDNMEW